MPKRLLLSSFFTVGILFLFISAKAQINVSTINYNGWGNSIELKNDKVKVVVVPEIGRIMHYSLLGEPNILHVSEDWSGKTLPDTGYFLMNGKPIWATFGGDRIWPSEEKNFVHFTGSVRPPDYYLDGKPWNHQTTKNGVKIESELSPFCGCKVSRTISLKPGSAWVQIHQRMSKVKMAIRQDLEPLPLTIWNLTKIKLPSQTFFPVSKNSILQNGYLIPIWDDAINHGAPNFKQQDGLGIFLPDKSHRSQKIVADAPGWVAGIVGDVVFAEMFEFDPDMKYPDEGTSIAIYMDHVAELECLSPLRRLKPGDSINYDLQWGILKLKSRSSKNRQKETMDWILKEN